ncbi:ShlB/FhaC/HecB family hemolysin secretion/activation protein [Calothrix sp. FACHB-156]|nr:ShlB/FhaC/HecB family hemolysin secretion/activation protein [Calothrix sp. FACHB-156]
MYLQFLAKWLRHLIPKFIAYYSLLCTPSVIAQIPPVSGDGKPNPNVDRFPQSLPTPQPLPPSDTAPLIPAPPTPTPPSEESAVSIFIRKIEVAGNTILNQNEIAAIIKPFEGRSATLKDLREVVNGITQLYIQRGYITSRAILVDQTITDGVVQILIIEGSLEKIEVEGTRSLNPTYIRNRINLGVSKPLKADQLEDQLRLLKADPLFTNIEASLKPGSELGKSILTVRVTEANALSGFVGIDNYSPPAVGSERLGGVISYRNLIGIGDELSASYYRSTAGGFNSFDFIYRVPINPMNGTLQLRYAPSDSRIIEPPFSDFNITADSQLYEISYRQPLIRSPGEEFALSLAFTIQDGQTFLEGTPTRFSEGPDESGNSKTRVLKFGQDYIKRDRLGAWTARSQFNFGLDVLDATNNAEAAPDANFFSWLGQLQRVQFLGKDNLLIVQADMQFSLNSLLPAQQFVIGGGQSLRGYRQNARSADSGFRLSIEDRIALQRDDTGQPNLQIAPFVDMGAVWNTADNPNKLTGETFLASIGLGLIWEPIPSFLVRLDYAQPLIAWRDRGENAQDRGFYFSAGYRF